MVEMPVYQCGWYRGLLIIRPGMQKVHSGTFCVIGNCSYVVEQTFLIPKFPGCRDFPKEEELREKMEETDDEKHLQRCDPERNQ